MKKEGDLTSKQLRILKYLEGEVKKTGFTPSLRKIAAHFKFSAIGTVQDYLAKLVDQGFLINEKGRYLLSSHALVFTIPILGNVPAGKPSEAFELKEGSLALTGRIRGEIFALKVHGESMRDKGIFDGDFVIVKMQAQAEHGEIVVAKIQGEATVKTLEKTPQRVRLLPANPKFQPIELSEDQENVIVGKVIGVQRYY